MKPDTATQPTSPRTQLEDVRNQIVNFMLLFGSLLGIVLLAMVTLTSALTGWSPYFWGFFGILIWWVTCTIARNHFTYFVRSITVVLTFYSIGLFNLLGWGLMGAAGIWFVVTVLLASTLISRQMGLLAYIATVVTYATLTLLVRVDLITFTIDFNGYAVNNVAWLSRTLVLVVITATTIVSLELLFDVLRDQVKDFSKRSEELADRTAELSDEITKRQQAEESLETAVSHLKDLDKLKDDFIDSISHELRTPLANIKLYHQLLAMRPENSQQYLQILHSETERLNQIVEQMIYSSADSIEVELSTMIDIDLKHIFMVLFALNDESRKKRGIHLDRPQTNKEYIVQAAPKHIERIVNTLVDNAIKYTPRGGNIVMEFLSDVSDDTPMVGVMVRNTSEPLTDAEQKKLFERFIRGKTSLDLSVPGAGLGLPTARELTRRYGGFLLSSYDDDSQMLAFTLWLPGQVIEPKPFKEEETKPSLKTPQQSITTKSS